MSGSAPAPGSAPSGSAAVVGATGLVGRECVRLFAASPTFERVVAIARRPLPPELRLPKVTERVVDFERLGDSASAFRATHLVCALGTTIKAAGSRERFRRVDYDYALESARLGAAQGARHFLLVSALGASAESRVFYNRVKGELEDAVRALPYRSVTIVRPSLLVGDRAELRLGEVLAKPLLLLAPPRYRPVHVRAVAAALLRAAVEDRPGLRIIESREIRRMAAR